MSSKKIFIGIILLAAISISFVSYFRASTFPFNTPIQVGSAKFNVFIAETPESRERGLSGAISLDEDQGLLMVFERDDKWAIWMKDMNFSLDILWFAEDGTLIYMKEDVLPETYPEIFMPTSPARFVLELPAGSIKREGIILGNVLVR